MKFIDLASYGLIFASTLAAAFPVHQISKRDYSIETPTIRKRQAPTQSVLWQFEEKRGRARWAARNFASPTDKSYPDITSLYTVSNSLITITSATNADLFTGFKTQGLLGDGRWRDVTVKPKPANGKIPYHTFVNANKGVLVERHINSTDDRPSPEVPDYAVEFQSYFLEAQRSSQPVSKLHLIVQQDDRDVTESHVRMLIHEIRNNNGMATSDTIVCKPVAGWRPDAFFALIGTLSGQRALDITEDFSGSLDGGITQVQVGPGDVLYWKIG